MSDYPHDHQYDGGSTAVDGRGNIDTAVSASNSERIIVWTYPSPDSPAPLLMTYLSPEGAISLAKALNAAAYGVLNQQVEASA